MSFHLCVPALFELEMINCSDELDLLLCLALYQEGPLLCIFVLCHPPNKKQLALHNFLGCLF